MAVSCANENHPFCTLTPELVGHILLQLAPKGTENPVDAAVKAAAIFNLAHTCRALRARVLIALGSEGLPLIRKISIFVQGLRPLSSALSIEPAEESFTSTIALGTGLVWRSAAPLFWAVEKGDALLVQSLLAVGINPNSKADYCNTPLHNAAARGHVECIRVLLDAPTIDSNDKNLFGSTPLHYAAINGRAGCIKVLLAATSINPNSKNGEGDTPLHVALNHWRSGCVRVLLVAPSIDLNSKTNTGDTLLHSAARNGLPKCVRALLAATSIDLKIKNNNGHTALDLAIVNGNTECAELLRAAQENG